MDTIDNYKRTIDKIQVEIRTEIDNIEKTIKKVENHRKRKYVIDRVVLKDAYRHYQWAKNTRDRINKYFEENLFYHNVFYENDGVTKLINSLLSDTIKDKKDKDDILEKIKDEIKKQIKNTYRIKIDTLEKLVKEIKSGITKDKLLEIKKAIKEFMERKIISIHAGIEYNLEYIQELSFYVESLKPIFFVRKGHVREDHWVNTYWYWSRLIKK